MSLLKERNHDNNKLSPKVKDRHLRLETLEIGCMLSLSLSYVNHDFERFRRLCLCLFLSLAWRYCVSLRS